MLEPAEPLALAPVGFRDCLSHFLSGLTDHRPLGVAVSGGSDSLGLLYGLAALVAPGRLFALTVDHGLRPGSAEEARRVKAHCRRLGVCHETLEWNAQAPASGLQAAARAARYRLLVAAASRLGLAAVLTGHTGDDQHETLEMRRARSPSDRAPGLAGIPHATLFEGRIWVLRPMLGLARGEIRDFLRNEGVAWIDDPSNGDTRFERVRVRRRLAETPQDAHASDGFSAAGSATAVVRSRLAVKAAAYLDRHASREADDRVRMRYRAGEDPEVIMSVLEALIDLCGGADRPLDRRGKATLAAQLRGWGALSGHAGNFPAFTLGRALIQRRDGDVVIRRERRGIATLELGPSASGVWDGRYSVRNLDRNSALRVVPGGAHGISPSFGRHLEGRLAEGTAPDGVVGGFLCRRLTGRSSRILPVYELPLAQALAALAGDRRFPACPWDVSAGETGFSAVTDL